MEFEFQELTDCPVCFVTFLDPQKLVCDHCVCKACVDRMKEGVFVRCPKCNVVSNMKDVKSDFRLIQFLEALAKQAEVLTQVQPKHDLGLNMCEFCEKHPILHHCVNCKQRICAECKIIHLRISSLKSHTILSLGEDIKASLQEESHRLNTKKLEFEQLVKGIEDATKQAGTIETDSINISKGLREDCIKEIHSLFDSYDARIYDYIAKIISEHEAQKKKIEMQLNEIEDKRINVEGLIAGDVSVMVSKGEPLLTELHLFFDSLMPPNVAFRTPVVEIVKNKTWDPTKAASLSFIEELHLLHRNTTTAVSNGVHTNAAGTLMGSNSNEMDVREEETQKTTQSLYQSHLEYNYNRAQWSPFTPERKQDLQTFVESRELCKDTSIPQEPVELHRTEKPYKIFSKTEEASDDDEIVVRQFRSILNKLTPQKFKILVEQILVLPINTEVRLKRCVDTFFEEAIDEPIFSVVYANASAILSKYFVVERKPNERISFKKLLLNRCQDEFQKSNTSKIEAMQKEIDEATTKKQKKILQENLEYAIMKNKRRSLGNIRFIGELFKLQMLTEKIMHYCVSKLIKSIDEEGLECLCCLLFTVGKILDAEKSKMRMDQYFQRIEKIIAGKQTSWRVRFMLRDVVDLRGNKWVPRRDDNNPKTIDQIYGRRRTRRSRSKRRKWEAVTAEIQWTEEKGDMSMMSAGHQYLLKGAH